MTTLHIENTVHDYDAWKAAFDRFERARLDRGVRSYRISRPLRDTGKVLVDLEFDDVSHAEGFSEFLLDVWRTPQSQRVVAGHGTPVVLDVLEERSLG